MKEEEMIFQWIERMICKYPWISFMYEYSKRYDAYCVAVFPKSIVYCHEEYCDDENIFYNIFRKQYPNVDLIFFDELDPFFFTEKTITFDQVKALV